jgi:hypothetical protein
VKKTKTKKYFVILLVLGLTFSFQVRADSSTATEVDKSFAFLGNGSIRSVSLNDRHCGYLPEGCHATMKGNWNTLLFEGVLSADMYTEWQHSTSNGRGGYCAPVRGTAEIHRKKGEDKIFVSVSGTDCDSFRSSEILPHVYHITFTVVGGTGKFKDAMGGGSVTGIDLRITPFIFRTSGHITLNSDN